ncbi:alpha/beta hydrolase [Rhodococcus sp. NPDC058521]|uniref:alpha/beta hydrolase n=1 Tax=Rhodococcus sp. NPDC058521 TaxID=3346536 RepID=UPI00365472A2
MAGLQLAGRWYANDKSPVDPDMSTLFTDLTGFPPIAIFTGTSDILLADARRFRERARLAGVHVDYNEFRAMFHNWIMHRMPEGSAARTELDRFLRTRPEVDA